MKLNTYQKLWVDTLKSGKTRKMKSQMNSKNQSMCCLGVAVKVCGIESLPSRRDEHVFSLVLENEDLRDFPKTKKALKIHYNGKFKLSAISPKWRKRIGVWSNLAELNDNTNLSHKEIGEFIDENREAVFRG